MKFVADSMLGKLAKWLRVLGYDTHYQAYYRQGVIDKLVQEGRCLLSRRRQTVAQHSNAVLLQYNQVGEQLAELREKVSFTHRRLDWFSRCLICNVLLKNAITEEVRENVPEYIFYKNMKGIRFCPSCRRYYWPGSHRARMISQLKEWGFMRDSSEAYLKPN